MHNLFQEINKRINGVIWSLTFTGIILIMLAILVASSVFVLKLAVSLVILVLAYIFVFAAYKLWSIKKAIENHFKF